MVSFREKSLTLGLYKNKTSQLSLVQSSKVKKANLEKKQLLKRS
jgi:hypothetical protein